MVKCESSSLPSDSSVDLSHYIFENTMLLSESITLSSLSTSTSSYSTLPLPAGCMIPLSTIIGNDGPTMRRTSLHTATLSSPTPPRLRTMLKEKQSVGAWVNSSSGNRELPGHTPWGGIENFETKPWIFEGSIYSPDEFKISLAKARARRTREQAPTPTISITSPSEFTSQRAANRNALVFEREIILDSGGESRRWSLQVPAKTMNSEMVDMMLELQSLNSFFKEGADPSVQPHPPLLVVSNSHFTLPVSLESSETLAPYVPLALAARRGKKMLPPLSFKPSVHDEYPSIPTAFLGSPSAYSPTFEFSSNRGRSSMDLQQMVTSLRSQCASIDSGTPRGSFNPAGTPHDNEWAFANDLLDQYASQPFNSDFVKKPLLPEIIDYAAESFADTPYLNNRRHTSSPNAPPSTPLPPCPPSQRTSVRSILKSSKSVRFASLPSERSVSAASLAPRQSLDSSGPLALRRRSAVVRPTLGATPPKSSPTQLRSPGQRRATTPAVSCRLSSPASPPAPSRRSATASGSPSIKSAATSGRNSLGRVFTSTTAARAVAKENKTRPSSPNPTTPTRTRWTLNENLLRRGSVSGAQKSRMPVPLRNILTKFK
ncbi:hypothetical protein C8J57DRAFT_1559298 [Mycena rebaudengoi]|nr:hypothetical protein C8J57DRAFT_1559298 [Mycena rebaudengoi]